jgi:galactokinase
MHGVKIVLLNTNVKHSLASSEYNTRRKECEQAVTWIKEKYPDVSSLRDVSLQMLDQCVKQRDMVVDKRARFVVQEMQRLQEGCRSLEEGNIVALGKKMFATHDGLTKMYEVSCKELDFLVDAVRDNDAVIGARMMGGGFGGCTINLIKEERVERLVAVVKTAYEREMNLPLTCYIASIEDGTTVV